MLNEMPAVPQNEIQQEVDSSPFRRTRLFLMTDSLETGGSERQFVLMSQALREKVFEVKLGCLRRQGAFLDQVGEIANFPLGGSLFGASSFRARVGLWRHFRKESTDISHSFDFYSNLFMIPVARLAGVPAVIGSLRHLGDTLTLAQQVAQAEVFRLCDRVLCNSEAAARRILQLGLPPGKVVVIPNGLPEDAFAEVPPALPKPPGVLRVGMVARMNESMKNHILFLRAAARLQRKFPDLEVVLAGDGPLRPELERMAEQLGFGRRARFLGDRRDIAAVLASVDISVQPSYSESLSNVILESMAAGRPVVAFRVGGNPELIRDGETGLLVPANEEEELSAAMEFLLSRPALLTEWGARARRDALAGHRLEHVREQYEKLYCGVLEEKNWQPRRSCPASRMAAASGKASAVGRLNRVRNRRNHQA